MNQSRPGPVLGQSLGKHAPDAGWAGARSRAIPLSGLSAEWEHPGRQPGLGWGKWCLGEVPGL